MNKKKTLSYLLPILTGIIIWYLPTPAGLETSAMQMLAIFLATIIGIIMAPLPMAAVALIGATIAVLTDTLTWKDIYTSNGTNLIWLVLMAFFISRAIIKCGLGRRVALMFLRLLGKKTIGLGYGIALTELVLAPAMPSITARAGGVMLPVTKAISEVLGSHPDNETRKKIGNYLIQTAFQCNVVTAAMFITAMAGNPLSVQLAGDQGIEISWLGWATAAIVPGIICLLIIPSAMLWLNKPEIEETPDAVNLAQTKLAEMGTLSRDEIVTLFVFIGLIFLWILGPQLFGIGSALAATMGVCALLITGVITWQDALEEKAAWDIMIWIGLLIMMAGKLNEVGLISWFSGIANEQVATLSVEMVFVVICLLYFYVHYFFASATAHIGAMYSASLAVLISVGIDPFSAAICLACLSNLMGCLTPYAIGSAPVLFGAGFHSLKRWLLSGFVMSLIYLVVWLGIGPIWWSFIGV